MKVIGTIVVLALMISAPLAEAGFKWGPIPVTVSPGSRFFDGHLGATRNSASYMERINCQVTGGVGVVFGSCWATDASGNSASCYSYDPSVVDAIRSVTSDSRITIYYDANGVCTWVYTHVDSGAEPKLP